MARDRAGKICRSENQRMIRYLEQAGITTLLYGGNAVLYHIRPSEYAKFLTMLVELAAAETLVVPAVGPAYGTMMDQAEILKDYDFPTAMVLPQKELSDERGIETGIRQFVQSVGRPVVVYLKHDGWLSPSTLGRLYRDGLLSWIKYAVVREHPENDGYLSEILENVPSNLIVSGMGEQPAIVHLRRFGLVSFTSGCVCVAPRLSLNMLRKLQAGDDAGAELIRRQFAELEELRNRIHPITVLHQAVTSAGISDTGPVQPLLGELPPDRLDEIAAATGCLLAIEQRQ
ncbi:MAG: dihydrodipicolinate synthase family protein [Pirellulaceae bacterium]|nr:dihydrodipicolinate synthase family protein [Pirellulaceae bacterium]